MDRSSIRPVTRQVVVETLRLLANGEPVRPSAVKQALLASPSRAEEILRQLERMNLVYERSGRYRITPTGSELLNAVLSEDRVKRHRVLMRYEPYRRAHALLETHSRTISEVASDLGISRVAAETIVRLLRWDEARLRKSKKTQRYYLSSVGEVSLETFKRTAKNVYMALRQGPFGISREYVKIPELRDQVCERLRLTDKEFDEIMKRCIECYRREIEVSAAPASVIKRSNERGLFHLGKHVYYLRIAEVKSP